MVALCTYACMCVMTGGKRRRKPVGESVARVEESLRARVRTHTRAQREAGVSERKKLSCVQFSLLPPLCSFILSHPFIYLYPFPHPLAAQQQPIPSPLLCVLRAGKKKPHPGRVPGSPLCMHSPKNASTKSTSIKI